MRMRQRFFVACLFAVGFLTSAEKSFAQIWEQYDVQYKSEFFNPLVVTPATGSVIPNTAGGYQFRDFAGNIDWDDGVASDIPTGTPNNPFVFEYNGNLYSSVNVGVNGFITIGSRPVPVVPNNNTHLFLPNEPNNTVAPFFGDHYYRTIEPGYVHSFIKYATTTIPDPNPNATPGAVLHTFTVEWTNLNVFDKTNPNSIATFQVKLIENPMANDKAAPDRRVIIEFHYGPIGLSGNVVTQGATVGIEDSVGFSHMNGLFPSSLANEDSTRLNTTARTSCWPPGTCLPGRAIQFFPQGRILNNQWGDGDVNRTQILSGDPNVRNNQSRFVTLEDADIVLRSRTVYAPGSDNMYLSTLDSVEGGPAFHADANHNGRYTNPNAPGFFFYKATAYDAAYILMYLAAKLPVLPWPEPLPVPNYKEAVNSTTSVSGVVVDAANARIVGNTVTVPVVLRGAVNGALGIEMNVKAEGATFLGTRPANGALISSNPNGTVAIAASGELKDGDVVGYLQFNAKDNAAISLTNVLANDELVGNSTATLKLAGGAAAANGFVLEQNAPNPFNLSSASATSISFDLGAAQTASLRVYNMLGNEVRTLVNNESFASGRHQVQWDGRDNNGNLVANGLYYYQLTSPGFTQTVKMEVVR